MDRQTDDKTLLEQEVENLIARTNAGEAIQKLKKLVLGNYHSSESRFKTIFEESSFGNKIINAELKIIKVNAALIKLLGYSAEELIGTLITDIAAPEYVEDWKRLQTVLWSDKQTSFSIDTCLLRKDKTRIWCHVTSIVFNDKDEEFGYTIIEDITERKNMERLRNELDAKKDEFIAIVSHELKTPLTTLKAINQMLGKAVSKDQTYYTFIQKSNHHISRLEKLIIDLLDVTKMQGGSIQLNLTTFDLNDLVQDCIAELQTIHTTHEIQFKRTAVPINVTADYFRIEQVLINLVNNAVKYSPDTNTVDIYLSEEGELAKVEVKDYGIGIDEKHVGKVFDRYYRVGEVSHHFQGLGLGLYISSQVIEKHDGKFDIESEPGKGSTFSFLLPQAG